jgi:hypothetical protein
MFDFIINHQRFKKQFNENELVEYLDDENRIKRFPQYSKNYYNFFNTYAKEQYKLIKNNCLCGSDNDIILSLTDRYCVNFITVVCKNCGLIRAKDYFRNKDVEDFYKNFYRTNNYSENYKTISPSDMFDDQKRNSKFKYDLLNEYKIKPLNKLKIIDLGGGVGGVLDHFSNDNEKYLFDFYDPYLNFAKTKGIKSVKGGLDKIDFKADIIILSHVIEHWSDFKNEIQKLINIQKKNETLNYIEFPGVDSIKKGRREGDILGDIHIPHVYYFTSYVFENIMNRYGFEKIYSDTLIKSIYIYTGNKKNLVNYYETVKYDLIFSEKIRRFQIFKNCIKFLMPFFITKIIRKIINKKIKF